MSSSLKNVLILSFSFFFICTSFNTSSATQKVVVNSVNKQTDVRWDAYLSLCLLYAVYSVSNFFVPPILTLISTKTCLFLSSLGYILYDLAFFYPFKYELIIASIVVGVSAGTLWPTQGKFISESSNEKTIDRNTGIFWAILQTSIIFGNLFIYFQFNGVIEITEKKRIQIYCFLTIVSVIGSTCLLFLKKPKRLLIRISDSTEAIEPSSSPKIKITPFSALKNCFNLFMTKKMFYLCIASFYTGVEQSFYQAVYATTVGFTKSFGEDSKKYIGLYGVSTGLGAVFGGIMFAWLLRKFVENNRNRIYTFGFLGHCVAFSLAFINHPNRAPIEETFEIGYIVPRIYICLIIGFLLCLGDACYNTQLIALISTNYVDPRETTSAFALYKFFHCLGASIAFLYASFNLTLITHLIILFVFGCLGTVSFYVAEKMK